MSYRKDEPPKYLLIFFWIFTPTFVTELRVVELVVESALVEHPLTFEMVVKVANATINCQLDYWFY